MNTLVIIAIATAIAIILLTALYIIVRSSLSLYIHGVVAGAHKEVGLFKLVKMR